jgi:D-alanine-D-alanine ligase
MNVAVVYNEPRKGAVDSMDVLDQVELVTSSLEKLGWAYTVHSLAEGGMGGLMAELTNARPDAVFNLVEEFQGETRRQFVAASVFEALDIPYTGAPFDALHMTTDKCLLKAVLSAEGLPTPRWVLMRDSLASRGLKSQISDLISQMDMPFPVIVKPAWEHASVGIDDGSVCHDMASVEARVGRLRDELGQPIIVEEFIDGRELNVTLLERRGGQAEALAVAELLFVDWPEGKPRIINYKAKWEEEAFEYVNTPRVFNPEDAPLELVKEIALRCWRAFRLKGYARVDMRLDREGRPFVLEVNSNPCIAPWSGYIAGALQAGITESEVIEEIVLAAVRGRRGAGRTAA